MRSRFAAFALGLGEYLVETLASDHDDAGVPREALVRELSRARDKQRFLGLRIVHATSQGDAGEVLFVARIFERGADRTFAELSTFVRENGRWRYRAGDMLPRAAFPESPEALTLASFRTALAEA